MKNLIDSPQATRRQNEGLATVAGKAINKKRTKTWTQLTNYATSMRIHSTQRKSDDG
jgi:hypothetical protein